jgi:hypothetical protein
MKSLVRLGLCLAIGYDSAYGLVPFSLSYRRGAIWLGDV